jgi:flagellar hook-associated protein 3 FlgL
MRVTATYYSDTLIQQLNTLQARQARLQQQAATGQRITLPEDDPSGMRQVLDLQTQDASLAQYASNITRQQELATSTYNVMSGLKTISDRVSEIATMADGTKSKDQLGIYAKEVTQLIQQAVQSANAKDRDSYLLSGTKSTTAPFSTTTDAAGNVTGVTYNGNTDLPPSEVAPGSTITAGAIGANTAGTGPQGLITDTRTGADFFNHLIQLQNDLLAGNTGAIQTTDKDGLAKDENNLLQNISSNGAVQARLETLSAMNQSQQTGIQQSVSNVADADITKTILNLNTTQTVYQAALQSSAKVMSMSLMNYLQ